MEGKREINPSRRSRPLLTSLTEVEKVPCTLQEVDIKRLGLWEWKKRVIEKSNPRKRGTNNHRIRPNRKERRRTNKHNIRLIRRWGEDRYVSVSEFFRCFPFLSFLVLLVRRLCCQKITAHSCWRCSTEWSVVHDFLSSLHSSSLMSVCVIAVFPWCMFHYRYLCSLYPVVFVSWLAGRLCVCLREEDSI